MSVRHLKQGGDDRLARRRELYAEWLADPVLERRLRAQQRATRDRMKADADSLAKRRASRLAYYYRNKNRERTEAEWAVVRERRRAQYVAARERIGKKVGAEPRTGRGGRARVPAEPFRKWLFAYGEWLGDLTAEAIAPELGLVVRRVYSWMYEGQSKVALDLVDQAIAYCPTEITVDGRVIYEIGDLYPELFGQEAA